VNFTDVWKYVHTLRDVGADVSGIVYAKGMIFVTQYESDTIKVYNCADPYEQRDGITIPDQMDLRAMAVSNDEKILFVTCYKSYIIWHVDIAEFPRKYTCTKLVVLNYKPRAISVTSSNQLLVTRQDDERLDILDANTGAVESFVYLRRRAFHAVQCKSEANTFVVCHEDDEKKKNVSMIYHNGVVKNSSNVDFTKPIAATFDGEGRIIVADHYGQRIVVLAAEDLTLIEGYTIQCNDKINRVFFVGEQNKLLVALDRSGVEIFEFKR